MGKRGKEREERKGEGEKRKIERRKDKPRENFGADALTTYRSRLLFFLVRPRVFLYSLPARSCRSIFSRFTLNHKYKSQERALSGKSRDHRSSSLPLSLSFCFRVVDTVASYGVYVRVCTCVCTTPRVLLAHTLGDSECTAGVRRKPLPRILLMFLQVRSICPDALFVRSRRQKNFQFATLQTSR